MIGENENKAEEPGKFSWSGFVPTGSVRLRPDKSIEFYEKCHKAVHYIFVIDISKDAIIAQDFPTETSWLITHDLDLEPRRPKASLPPRCINNISFPTQRSKSAPTPLHGVEAFKKWEDDDLWIVPQVPTALDSNDAIRGFDTSA